MAPSSRQLQAPLPPLIPPFRLCAVEDGVYRGAHPSLKNMRFLRRLKLRTILSLVPEPSGPCKDLAEYCAAENIRHVWHHVEKYDDGFSHTPELVASLLSEIVDERNHPLFMHCRDGAHNTGLVVMCLRRLENWSLPTIYQEFIRYTKSNEISFAEKQFVESFHATVRIPTTIPAWLWEGVRHEKHPSIRLHMQSDSNDHTAESPSSAEIGAERKEGERTATKAQVNLQQKRGQPYIQIRIHFVSSIAALDLYGVYFLGCCRPDIEGNTPADEFRNDCPILSSS